MPAIVFKLPGGEQTCEFRKVDRSALYGSTRTEAQDAQGRPCRLATLADDGRTLIEAGGTALAQITADGRWADKAQLRPVDLEGNPLTPVPSTLKAPIELSQRASIDEYLAHIVSSTYLLEGLGDELAAELRAGAIYTFPFSYRGGLTADQAFLLAGADGACWLAVGKRTQIHFVGLEEAAPVEEAEAESDEDDDSMDFGMM